MRPRSARAPPCTMTVFHGPDGAGRRRLGLHGSIFSIPSRWTSDKCVGCTNCIKRCPTEAIRVREGKAQIISERCIDCGECIRVCPHHAKKAQHDPFELLKDFTYTVALPAPALYGQFNHLDDIDIVLTGLKAIGFDDVFEVSRGAEIISDATRQLLEDGKLKKPVISSACPAVVRLIRVRFPDLCDHVLPLKAPMEVAARHGPEGGHGENRPATRTDRHLLHLPLRRQGDGCPGALSASNIPMWTACWPSAISIPRWSAKMNHLEKTGAPGQIRALSA